MNIKWKKVIIEIVKYAVGAICGACGITLTGCANFFNF